MASAIDARWGPYQGPAQASLHLSRYVDHACDPAVGILWASSEGLYPLRAPKRDTQGLGEILIFQWMPIPPPRPAPRQLGRWEKIKAGIKWALAQDAKAQMAEADANRQMAQAVVGAVKSVFSKHPDDAAGVALDIICVAATIILLPEVLAAAPLVMAAGLAAGFGGAALLAMDGASYAMELSGDEEDAELIKKRTEVYRLIATAMTLPDLAYGGYKAITEYREIKTLMEADTATAQAAERMGGRTGNSDRAKRYEQIAERAHLRAQIRAEQLAASRKLELLPRAAGGASLGLLTREETDKQSLIYQEVSKRLHIHPAAVHKMAGVK